MTQLVPRRARVEGQRRRRGRRSVVARSLVALVSVLLLALGAKLVVMVGLNHSGRAAMDRLDHAGAESRFRDNQVWNWFDPWVPYYNAGVALYYQRNWDGAQDQFEQALARVPRNQRCTVALNLAWTLEAKGDGLLARKDAVGAGQAFSQASQVAKDAQCDYQSPKTPPPPKPNPEDSDQNRDQGTPQEQQSKTEQRLADKQKQAKDAGSKETEQQEQPSQAEQLKKLGEQNKQAQQTQQQKTDADTAPADPQGKEPGW